VRAGQEDEGPADEGRPDSDQAVGPATLAEGLQKITEGGLISPRDASLAAGRMGIKALPEANSDACALYGVTSRQGRNVTRRVAEVLHDVDDNSCPAAVAPPDSFSPEPKALVAAELALSAHPMRSDGSRALDVLRWQEQALPVRRSGSDTPAVPGGVRARQHRFRRHLQARIDAVSASPARSVGMPFLVLPMSLDARLLELVPAAQRRRGRPPDLDWLASQVHALRTSYDRRDVISSDLAKVVLWGFAQYPTSPDRYLEADALHTAASIAREHGSLSSYWMAERVRYLVRDLDIRTILSAHDSIITLRNGNFWGRSRRLLDESLAALDRSDIPYCDRSWIQQLLLSLAPIFFSGINPVITSEEARAYCREAWAFPYGFESSQWLRQTRRAEFEIEYTVARRRSWFSHERLWLGPNALRCFDAADLAMLDNNEPMYSAQWSLMKMRLGIDRRDTAEIVTSARGYLELGSRLPWIFRDHHSERLQYSRYRTMAIQKNRQLDRELPEIKDLDY
jgi:hypothetical protein